MKNFATESQPPKPKPIQKNFATETENRKSATETETDSKYFCHRNRKLKPIDKKQLIIVQYEKSETTKKWSPFLTAFLIVSKNAVCKRLRSF